MSILYSVGNGERTQMSMREDGMWFIRKKWHGQWLKWQEHGKKKPYEFGMYVVLGQARLPDVAA